MQQAYQQQHVLIYVTDLQVIKHKGQIAHTSIQLYGDIICFPCIAESVPSGAGKTDPRVILLRVSSI